MKIIHKLLQIQYRVIYQRWLGSDIRYIIIQTMKRNIFFVLLLLIVTCFETFSCTVIMVRDENLAIAGSNEDFLTPLSMMWYIPATDRYYARICFGFYMGMNSTQGGMNEHGLFVDGNSVAQQGWKPDNSRKNFMGSVIDHILASYKNIEEVKEFFRTFNNPSLNAARIPVMDKSGTSMIVEWYNGEVVFLETERDYQIATNFIGSAYVGKENPCWRYNRATELLDKHDIYSLNTVREVLNATHVSGFRSNTIYSFICDLKSGEIQIYNFHDFKHPLKLKFNEEIKKGNQSFYLAELFENRSDEYKQFIKDAPLLLLNRFSGSNNFQASIFYGNLRSEYPALFNIEIGPEIISEFALKLIEEGRLEDSIFFLERNTRDFPDDPTVHFELAEALQKANQTDKALKEYRKTLELDPEHARAKKAINALEQFGRH